MFKDFETMPYFTLSQLALIYKDKKSAAVVVSNKLRQKKLFNIREWIYISDKKYNELVISNKINSFSEFCATNLIYTPSYLSTEYILFVNNIITENVYTITLITTKKTANFQNIFGKFLYQSIKKDFFGDYEVVKKDGLLIYQALPEKALFDYLYLKKWIVFSESYIQELRLNLENINFKVFERIVKKYKSKKVQKIFTLLCAIRWL